MGKRTKEKSDEEIERKIKRLEKELNSRNKRLSPISQNEDRDWDSLVASQYNYQDEVDLDVYPADSVVNSEESMLDTHEPVHTEASVHAQLVSPDENIAEDQQPVQNTDLHNVRSVISVPTTAQAEEDKVPDEIMEVLGEAKKSEETFGKKIPQGVSERLGKILIQGLAKEQKDTLLTKTLIIPENFQLVKAPKLNTEVASALTDPAKNRDKRLEKLQNQLGSGIAGLVNLTTELINTDLDKMSIIKRISEVNQILLDLHYEETMSRRRLIIPMLDKSFINIIQNVKRAEFLFGDNLNENIKSSKSIERSSLQIKKSVPPQPFTSRKPLGQTGNSRVPARQASGPGAARAQPSTSRYYPPPPPPASRRAPAMNRRPPPPPPPLPRGPQDPRSRRR